LNRWQAERIPKVLESWPEINHIMLIPLHCGRHWPAVLLAAALFSGGATMRLWAQAGGTAAQDPSVKAPAYEVVSIKPANPGDRSSGWKDLPDGLDFRNMPLVALIYEAYGISSDSQISGLPDWVKSEHYNVSARADEDTVEAWKKLSQQDISKQQQLMLQALFADRCQLKVRREVKDLPVYDLVIAKGGLKMKEAAPNEKGFSSWKTTSFWGTSGSSSEYAIAATTHAGTAHELAQSLAREAGRIVVDKTSLGDKKFDYELKWSSGGQALPDAANAGPSIFKALEEQLGLKLEPAKEPVDTFVVEHIERPSAN
jgi:uncharacterized protein (TIGR03435 family)